MPDQTAPTTTMPPAEVPAATEPAAPGMVITALATLPAQAIVDEAALARAFRVTPRSVRRMVNRLELPPPVRLAGKSSWFAGHVLAHIQARAETAARDAAKEAQRIRQLSA